MDSSCKFVSYQSHPSDMKNRGGRPSPALWGAPYFAKEGTHHLGMGGSVWAQFPGD